MKTLIITAHPSTRGFTHQIAFAFAEGRRSRGDEAEILDLYKTDLKQDYFAFEDIKDVKPDPIRGKIQSKIKGADELVFVFPLWWMGMPAILKNFIDTNFTPGFAYRYEYFPVIKGRPVGLLKGRTARVFVTCDGPRWFYKLLLTPFKLNIKWFTLGLCGLNVRSFTIFDRMRWRTKEEKRGWLARVNKIEED